LRDESCLLAGAGLRSQWIRRAEIKILGVNFSEGDEVVCTKESGGNPSMEAATRVHDVRTLSPPFPARGTFIRLAGKLGEPSQP